MRRIIIIIVSFIIVIIGIISAVKIFVPSTVKNIENIGTKEEIAQEEILDDCTDEFKQMEKENIVTVNSKEERISPNSSITIRTFYKDCGHVKSEYNNIPEELVNLTKEELQERYKDYEIEKYSSNEIILYKDENGECGEHYFLQEQNGKIVIFKLKENGGKELIEETGISTEYLPDTDRIIIKNGIEVDGKQNLNSLIEDFE